MFKTKNPYQILGNSKIYAKTLENRYKKKLEKLDKKIDYFDEKKNIQSLETSQDVLERIKYIKGRHPIYYMTRPEDRDRMMQYERLLHKLGGQMLAQEIADNIKTAMQCAPCDYAECKKLPPNNIEDNIEDNIGKINDRVKQIFPKVFEARTGYNSNSYSSINSIKNSLSNLFQKIYKCIFASICVFAYGVNSNSHMV